MRLSRGKINHLSKLVVDALDGDPGVRLQKDFNVVRLAVVSIITEEVKRDSMVGELAREKISSQKRDFPEGGREWEILYKQYYREETEKHRPPRE
ncbi:MAG TPA: DUF507 family protein [Acidobacteriota bacterium]|nr:DUF507 family protein [Acidobacteriota bacterium]